VVSLQNRYLYTFKKENHRKPSSIIKHNQYSWIPGRMMARNWLGITMSYAAIPLSDLKHFAQYQPSRLLLSFRIATSRTSRSFLTMPKT